MPHPAVPSGSARRKYLGFMFETPPASHSAALYADKVFDFNDWDWHRNAAWRHRLEPRILAIVASGFIWQIIHVLCVGILVGLYHEYLVPLGAPRSTVQLTQAFSMITFCLSLLLVFRTNSSYARWWEARTLWGSVVNLSRNYGRQMMVWAPPERTHIARLGARWMVVAVHVMRAHLRQGHIGKTAAQAIHALTPQELEWLSRWKSAPQGAAHILAWAAANLNTNWQREQVLQELVNKFVDNLGGCERILRTPLPTAYTRHTSRFLLVYVTLAPALLWPVTGWGTPLLAAFIAFLLLGTENIGVQIEEPFKVLPLDSICTVIETSISDMERQFYGSTQLGSALPVRVGDDPQEEARQIGEGVDAHARLAALLVGSAHVELHVPTVHGPLTAMAAKSLSKRVTSSSLHGGHPATHMGPGAHHHHGHAYHMFHGAAAGALHHSGGGSGVYFSNGGDLHSTLSGVPHHLQQVPEAEAGNEADPPGTHGVTSSNTSRKQSIDGGLVRLPSVRLTPPGALPSQALEDGGGGGVPASAVAAGPVLSGFAASKDTKDAQHIKGVGEQHYMSSHPTELGHLPAIRSLPPGTIQQLAAQAARANAEAKQAAARPTAVPAHRPSATGEEDTQPLIAKSTAY